MLTKIKEQLFSLITELGYLVVDNRDKQQFPCILIRTANYNRTDMFDTRIDYISIVLDIFSSYKGEKEIIDIVENISDHIQILRNDNPNISSIIQKDLKILQDKSIGPTLEHGIVVYQFILASGLKEVEDETSGSTGD